MLCKSGSANKFKHHVSCVLPPSHLRISLQFKLHQHQNLQPATKKRSLRNYFRGIGDALHSSKIKLGSCQDHPTCPEAGNELKNI